MDQQQKKYLWLGITAVIIIAFYILIENLNADALMNFGSSLSLPLTTVFIAFVDGFNPCNIFVLGMLLLLMISEGHDRKKILAVGLTFVGIVYVIYFAFMSAWLNVVQYVGFVRPMRIAIAIIALVVGIINLKEKFFFRKGVTLMIQDKYLGKLREKIKKIAASDASTGGLMFSAALLAIFASLIELPCTAGFPLVYTGILSGQAVGVAYYSYLALYNLIYVMPLLVIVTLFSFGFHEKTITKKSMGNIKFVAGLIMILLAILLLTNPGLLGVG